MKILVIAEKPSQGKIYAQALGNFVTKDGFLENDKYIITWAYGHLIELANDNVYRNEGMWDKSYLPLIPSLENFKYVAKEDNGVKRQLSVIKNLLEKTNLIYCATDADREGELIFRYIYNYFNCKIPFKRVWISSLDEDAIRNAFENPKFSQGDSFIENLSKSAYSRAIADWLVGINGTQAATLQLGRGKLLSIGRVQTIILKIICERFLTNTNHIKSFSYKIHTKHNYNGIDYIAESSIFQNKEEVIKAFNSLNNEHIFVNTEENKDVKKAPLLHTLDSLTIVSNRLYKYNASEVLSSAQKLYDNKLISYPRTEDPYITEETYSKLKKYLPILTGSILDITNFKFPDYTPLSVNGSKITGSHDAIIPTSIIPNINNLSKQDLNIYKLILYRCLESFSDEAIWEKKNYSFINNNIPFITRSNKLIKKGWLNFSPTNDSESEENNTNTNYLYLPYQMGESVTIYDKNIHEIASKPPAIYNPASLTEDLSNLSKFLQQESPELYNVLIKEIDLKSLQIGTKATRPDILNQLINKRKFIEFNNNKYLPTDLGIDFYNTIKNIEVVNVASTAKLEYSLHKVFQGKISENDFYKEVKSYVERMVKGVFENNTNISISATKINEIGLCPKCKKGKIVESNKGFGCNEWKQGCDFFIWKTISEKKLSTKNVCDLIKNNKTGLINNFISKNGKKFSAYLILDNDFKTKFEFNN